MRKPLLIFVILITLCLSAGPSLARYNAGWNWRTIQTEHFTIYYPQGYEEVAQRILTLSSEVYRDVTEYLGVTPPKCPIVLNPGTDMFNGIYTPFPNRISLFEVPLFTTRGFGPGSDLMDMVFTHEYTHFVHITTRLGWYGTVSRVLGDGAAISNILSPGWAVEGLATNTETLFTDGGRGRCSFFTGKLMSFTEGEGIWNLSAAGVSPSHTPPANRIYLAGYHMIDYLNTTYGSDSFARLGRYQAKHPVGGTQAALRHVTGKDPGQFYREFLADFREKAAAQKEKALGSGLTQGKVISSEELESYTSHFWTDENTIVALRIGYDKKNAFVTIDPETGSTIKEIPTGKINALTPVRKTDSNTMIAFGNNFPHILGEGDLLSSDLTLFDTEKREFLRLTRDQHIYSADLSPNKTTFVAARRNGMWTDLILLDRDGKNLRPLVSTPGIYCEAPVWSPDGSLISAVVKIGQNADIILIDPETGEMNPLFNSDLHEDNEPDFSPDGQWIVFSSNRTGMWNIFAWNRETERLFQLTSEPYAATEPRISPDGKTLSFFSMYRGVNRLCTLPFTPEKGKEIPVEKSSQLNKPDLARLTPEVNFESKGIPIAEAWKPFLHVPYFSSDEEGDIAGIALVGADPTGINSYLATVFYGFGSSRAGADINLTNKSFWPVINARFYDSAEEGNTLSGDGFWFRERGAELSLSLNMIPQTIPSQITSTLTLGGKQRNFEALNGGRWNPERDNDTALFGELTLTRIPDTPKRDTIPAWASSLFYSYEKGLSDLGGELPGYNTVISATQYLPALFRHDGFKLALTHQSQSGNITYDKDISIPRGYSDDDREGGLNLDKNLLTTAEYHFPISYIDDGIGLILLHVNLLKASLFIDHGAGWNNNLNFDTWKDRARTTIGGTLTARTTLLSLIPVELGIEAGYKTRDNEAFANFLVLTAF